MQRVGIVAFQGDVDKHGAMLTAIGAEPVEVRTQRELTIVDRLIIPGGESTTIGMLMEREGLLAAVRHRLNEGMPVFGTCAGMILLADKIIESSQPRVGGLRITVERNGYGRQLESFETALPVPELAAAPISAVFIRAPIVRALGAGVRALARFEDVAVLVRQDHLLAASFHPELTRSTEVHRYFLSL